MVKSKSIPRKVPAVSIATPVGKKPATPVDPLYGMSKAGFKKLAKELVKECAGNRTIQTKACSILQGVLEKHCTTVLQRAESRANAAGRVTVTGHDVKKEARILHAEMWPDRFRK